MTDLTSSVISALSLHDALPISLPADAGRPAHPALRPVRLRGDPPGMTTVQRPAETGVPEQKPPRPRRRGPMLGRPLLRTSYEADMALFPSVTQRVVFALFLLRSEEHTSELQSRENLVCRLLLEK